MPSRLTNLRAVAPAVVSARLRLPLPVTREVTSTSFQPDPTAPDAAAAPPIGGAFEYVTCRSPQVSSATPWTLNPALDPVVT